MKGRLCKKIYVVTLLTFIFLLLGSMLSMFLYTYNQSVNEKKSVCEAECAYIVQLLRQEIEAAENTDEIQKALEKYVSQYYPQKTYFMFKYQGRVFYSSMPGREITELEYKEKRYMGERYIFLDRNISGPYGVMYAKYAGDLDIAYRNLLCGFLLATLVLSLLLAIALAIILNKLFNPLNALRKTTEMISQGDLSVVADESGKDEISVLAHSFNNMVKQIKSQMSELSENADRNQLLVDNMAHELRTPLTSILGYAEYADKAAISEDDRIESMQCVISEAERLRKISEKMLDMAYMRNNNMDPSPVRLDEVLYETSKSLRMIASGAGVTIETDMEACEIPGDRVLLSVLFSNLTENAIKACETGGKVILSCRGNTAVICDNGKGINAEQIPHLTEPFYRTDKSRSRAEGGTGLGLALCKQIVISHNAEMNIESIPGMGTKISVIFKRKQMS